MVVKPTACARWSRSTAFMYSVQAAARRLEDREPLSCEPQDNTDTPLGHVLNLARRLKEEAIAGLDPT